MQRHFKTSQKNRTTYIYYDAEGRKVMELQPGEYGVTEAYITILHEMDDLEVDEHRRFEYHTSFLDTYRGNEEDKPNDYDLRLADSSADPENIFLQKEDEAERQSRLDNLRRAMEILNPQQLELFRKIYVDKRSKTDIAAEENVTEAAIRNRLKKMHEKLREFFP